MAFKKQRKLKLPCFHTTNTQEDKIQMENIHRSITEVDMRKPKDA